METYIKGNYKRSIYTSDNGFVIGLFKIKETNEENLKEFINKTITFTGQFVELNVDDTYFFYGEMVEHQKYGLQFKVNEYERVKPSDKDGIIEFLSSDLFNGIGEKIATQIVETLGENALDKILEEKSNLYLVPKLSSKKIDIIYNTLTKYEESHKTIVYLTELGFNMKDSLNIYNFYKSNTIIQIESNIFKIIDDIEEISFTKIDEISKKLNYKENDINRIKSCILYVMKSLTYKNGDTYLNLNEIYINAINYLKIELNKEEFNTYLDELSIEQKIHIENDKYYLNNIYEAENNVSNKLNTLLNIPLTKYKKLDTYIELLEKENNIKYDEIQLTAIKKALENNLLIITGGPGTGKTTIIKSIVQLYKLLNKLNDEELINEISLLAPTGRASKRLSEATLFPATTIHRFLGWNKELNSFKIDEYNKDKSKLIIIDEVSMIDISLIDNLLKGLNDNIKLILVGDFNQLPSVGPGQVLKDFINSDIIDVVKLKLLYRQNENSYIPVLAKEINDNNLSSDFYETRDDYTFLECTNYSLKNTIISLAETIEKKGYDYKKVQIMAPMYAGVNGIDSLNKELQNVFNKKDPEKREIKYFDVIYRENDKVLQLVNMPDENVFNGDLGTIKYIIYANTSKSGKDEIYIDYDGNIVKYLPKDFNKFKHGFVISIHKSQGSEFELVVLPITSSYGRMLSKKLIYTAVTRAKRKLIIVGDPNVFKTSIKNDNEYERKTTLKEKLIFMNNFKK